MHTVFNALILSRITYALPVWGGHLTKQQRQRINAFLKRARKYGFTEELYSIEELLEKADARFFGRMLNWRIVFTPFYLIRVINRIGFSLEKEDMHLAFHSVLSSPVVFLSLYNLRVCVVNPCF